MASGRPNVLAVVAAVCVASYGMSAYGISASQAVGVPVLSGSQREASPLPYDLNGDGYAEVVPGAPGERLSGAYDAGMLHVLPGTPSGATGTGSVAIHEDTPGVPGVIEEEVGSGFGQAMASGDFNGDGYADVAVSGIHEDLGFGAVWVFPGSAHGLRTNAKVLELPDAVRTASDPPLNFGFALAAGDFDGDGRDDLAIGTAHWSGLGQVYVYHGAASGDLVHRGDYSQATAGVPGVHKPGDAFGSALAAGDANGDGRDDLAVGAPYDYEDRGWATGSVTMLYGSSDGLTGSGAQRWSKDSAGVPGSPGRHDDSADDAPDLFGWRLALGDLDGDSRADLAVGAPGSPVTVDGVRKWDAGTATVLYADGSGIGVTGATQVSQQTAGMPGVAGQRDGFSAALAAGDSDGDGDAELAVYSHGDTYVTVVPGGPTGLRYGGAKAWTQNSPGIPGTTEARDWWGSSLRFVDVRGTGQASLVVGAVGENRRQGALTVIPGSSAGLTAAGAQFFSQDSPGVPGTAETSDAFGTL